MTNRIRSRITRRAPALCMAVLLALPVVGGTLQAGTVHAATSVTAGFLNASEYPIVALTVDGRQIVPGLANTIPPMGTLKVTLASGPHTYAADSGPSSSASLYTFRGTFTAQPVLMGITRVSPCLTTFVGRPLLRNLASNCVVVSDPTITTLLTRFSDHGIWTGSYLDDQSIIHAVQFEFFNGTYTFTVDGTRVPGTGTFMEVGRDPVHETVSFTIGAGLTGVFYEAQGTFVMNNGPHNHLVTYS